MKLETTGLPEFLEDDHRAEEDLWGLRWMIPEEKEKERAKR
jgi:hypothetical protein